MTPYMRNQEIAVENYRYPEGNSVGMLRGYIQGE
jgi:hypothetical protein